MIGTADQAYNKGIRCAKQGRLSEAQKLLHETIGLDPTHTDAQNVLGKVYLHLGDLSAAKSCWRQSLALSPGDATASKCLATLRRSELGWQFRTALCVVMVLALLACAGYVTRQLQLPGKMAQTAAFVSQIPSRLRAQPVSTLKSSEDTQIAAVLPAGPATKDSELGNGPVPSGQETVQSVTDNPVPPTVEGPQLAEAPSNVPSETQATPALLPKPETQAHRSTPASSVSTIKDKQEVSTVYGESLSLFREGQHAEAIKGFQSILASGFDSSLLDNAQFWLGECYVSQGRYSDAIKAFSQVELLPDGNKVHDAQIRLRKVQSFMESN